MHALSRATYRRLREGKPDSVQIMYVDETPGSAQLQSLGFGGGRMRDSTPEKGVPQCILATRLDRRR